MSLNSSNIDAFLQAPIAHRGLHDVSRGIIENSASAFHEAIVAGYGIECDIQFSKDRIPLVFHDDGLKRLTGQKGRVRDFAAKALQTISLTGSHDQIDTLADMAELVGGRVPLLIEIKDQSGALSGNPDWIAPVLCEALAGYEGPLAIMSFAPDIVAALRKMLPEACLGLTTDNFLSSSWATLPRDHAKALNRYQTLDDNNLQFLSHNRKSLSLVKSIPLPKLCWTVKTPAHEEKARQIADNITFEGYLPKCNGH